MTRDRSLHRLRRALAFGLAALVGIGAATNRLIAADAPAATTEASPPREEAASIRVTGLGWWKNRELRRTLRLLEPEDSQPTDFDAALLEDAAVLLQSALERDGFLRSSGVVRVWLDGEPRGEFPWTTRDVPALPRDLRADEAVFDLTPGVRYHFDRLTFTGLAAIREKTARSYFVEEGFLFGGGATHQFTPAGLRRGIRSLREQLVRLGHADANVAVAEEKRDETTGRVQVTIAVDEGPTHRVREVLPPADAPAEIASRLQEACNDAASAVDSPLWRQNFEQTARVICFAAGHANAEVELTDAAEPVTEAGTVWHVLQLAVQAGAQIRVGTVQFSGPHRTAESVLRRATTVKADDLFDRSRVEQDRLQLGALGAFRAVRATVQPVSPDRWDLTYELQPTKRIEASLLAGYGSYEGLRGGVEVVHTNLLKRAHRGRLQLILSEKSTYGDYLYTVPQIFGLPTDASTRVFGLQRDEVSFERKEVGVSVGARSRIDWLGVDSAVRYQFESIRAEVFDPVVAVDAPTDSNVASLTLDLTRDRLDNPITPRGGYLLAFSLETAAKAIGGEVDYQRLDLRASWHRRVGSEKYVHVGFRHGVAWSLGDSSAADIPLARRYFPGGEGTIRGYTEGRASPRAVGGAFIGAEVSTILNVEFEQSLARNLAAVLFVDAGLTAARLAEYPGDQTRVSVGLGLRYNSVIGPARLEYGRNVVSESGDGTDAWHLALGFPF